MKDRKVETAVVLGRASRETRGNGDKVLDTIGSLQPLAGIADD
ncbi:MAG: hypothetical protein ACTHMG_15290 [Sphingomonas sp.]